MRSSHQSRPWRRVRGSDEPRASGATREAEASRPSRTTWMNWPREEAREGLRLGDRVAALLDQAVGVRPRLAEPEQVVEEVGGTPLGVVVEAGLEGLDGLSNRSSRHEAVQAAHAAGLKALPPEAAQAAKNVLLRDAAVRRPGKPSLLDVEAAPRPGPEPACACLAQELARTVRAAAAGAAHEDHGRRVLPSRGGPVVDARPATLRCCRLAGVRRTSAA